MPSLLFSSLAVFTVSVLILVLKNSKHPCCFYSTRAVFTAPVLILVLKSASLLILVLIKKELVLKLRAGFFFYGRLANLDSTKFISTDI
jgi:hypothetical protein